MLKKTRLSRFPDPRQADEHGLVCFGGQLEPDLILEAYEKGIFPWPHEGMPLLWFSPRSRGVLDFSLLHIPRRLARMRRTEAKLWRRTWNTAFSEVMSRCQKAVRKEGAGSWINPTMIKAYGELHRRGHAHSLEVWDGAELIAGIYGVWVRGVFSGESMFGARDNASKIALVELVLHLRSFGVTWIDTQMVTPVVGQLGAREISQDDFLARLNEAHAGPVFDLPGPCSLLPHHFSERTDGQHRP